MYISCTDCVKQKVLDAKFAAWHCLFMKQPHTYYVENDVDGTFIHAVRDDGAHGVARIQPRDDPYWDDPSWSFSRAWPDDLIMEAVEEAEWDARCHECHDDEVITVRDWSQDCGLIDKPCPTCQPDASAAWDSRDAAYRAGKERC